MVRRLRRRAGRGPGGIRHHAARRRYHLDARTDQPVTDHSRHRRSRRGDAPRRCARGRRCSGSAAPSATARSACSRPRRELADPDGFLADRYRLPRPRLGTRQRPRARPRRAWMFPTGWCRTSAISAAPLASAAEIEAAAVPLSPAARAAGDAICRACLTGGDDYELAWRCPLTRSPPCAARPARCR